VFETWLKAKGFDPAAITDAQRTSLQAMYDQEQAIAAAGGLNPQGGSGTPTPTPTPTTTVAASGQPSTLDEIFAARRAEDARIQGITAIARDAVNDRPMLTDEIERMSRAAIEARAPVAQFELEVLRLRANAGGTTFAIRHADNQLNGKILEASICSLNGLAGIEKHYDERTLEAAHRRFPHGIGLIEMLQIAARENTGQLVSPRDLDTLLRGAFPAVPIRAAAFSTFSLPGTLSNVANKFLVAGFNAVDDTWSRISSERPVKDFKQVTSYSLTGGFMYEEVGPTGELKHGTVGELIYSNQAKTYGRMFAITRTDLINDDLGALTQVPMRLGRGAALKLNDVFWSVFLNNSTFFSSGNNNVSTGAGSALSLAGLDAANQKFLVQTDPDGFPVAVQPKILLVPSALKVTANTLVHSTQVANNTTANTTTMSTNPFAGLYQIESSPYMSNSTYTGNSSAAWYLLADPADVSVIEVAFLNGRKTPIVENAEADFHSLGVQFRGYHDFGVSLQEFRGGVRSAGS
jgi:hypothetical protein